MLSRDPFRLLITPTGIDKGKLHVHQLLIVDQNAEVVQGNLRPSAETWLHIPIVEETGADVVLHTHSSWNTLASLTPAPAFQISGFEMLKGLSGVTTHEHRETIPILENSQDIPALSRVLRQTLRDQPEVHAVLLRGHGLYTWGCDIFEAQRHLEVLEFLFELTWRGRNLEA